jgi:hypothetical protein
MTRARSIPSTFTNQRAVGWGSVTAGPPCSDRAYRPGSTRTARTTRACSGGRIPTRAPAETRVLPGHVGRTWASACGGSGRCPTPHLTVGLGGARHSRRARLGHGPAFRWTGPRNCGNVLVHRWPYGRHRHHPTEKPVELLGLLIELVTLPGDVVLDLFAGSGSTLVAAKLAGRSAIGCELVDAYCSIAPAGSRTSARSGPPDRRPLARPPEPHRPGSTSPGGCTCALCSLLPSWPRRSPSR